MLPLNERGLASNLLSGGNTGPHGCQPVVKEKEAMSITLIKGGKGRPKMSEDSPCEMAVSGIKERG